MGVGAAELGARWDPHPAGHAREYIASACLIPGLEIAVAQRPGRRHAVDGARASSKSRWPQAEVMGAIHLGGTTHEVMASGLERLALARRSRCPWRGSGPV
jgi:hypothetical protein